MRKVAAGLAGLGCFFVSLAAGAAEIDVQRNEPVLIDGVLYPLGGKPLVMPDMAAVLEALPTPRSEVNAIANLEAKTPVHVVVLDMMIDANAMAMANAREVHREDIERLQNAISANAAFRSELESKSVPVSAVLAAGFTPDGGIVLYALA